MNFKNLKTSSYKEEYVAALLESNSNPVLISFLSSANDVITVPVWTYFYQGKFYLFTGIKSLKVKSIKQGFDRFSLIVVDKNSFPDVYSSQIPYISVSGTARIVSASDNKKIPEIHLKLLEKYNYDGAPEWLPNLIAKIKKEPSKTWLIEIEPSKTFVFNEL